MVLMNKLIQQKEKMSITPILVINLTGYKLSSVVSKEEYCLHSYGHPFLNKLN